MENEQLAAVPASEGNQRFSIEQLEYLLKVGGPILFSWEKLRRSNNVTVRHMSVVIGVDKDRQRVIYHDPETREEGERSANASMPIEQFNIVRDVWEPKPLLQRSPETTPIAEKKEPQQRRAESSRARQNRMKFFTKELELKGHLLR